MSVDLHDGFLQIFDVDHGQCAMLTMPNSSGVSRVLIDCGHANNFNGRSWYPGEHLQSLGVSYVDLLICTNYDEDHASGFPDLVMREISIGCILGNPTVAPGTIIHLKSEDGMGSGIGAIATALGIRQQMGWQQVAPSIPGLSLTRSWNPYPAFDDENDLSLVATLDIKGFRFMFPGDMERTGWNNLLSTCPPFRQTVAGVDVLIASHHGRENGIWPDMFDVYGCKPQLVVISDDYKQYATQETTNYYGSKVRGLRDFRGQGPRFVLTTRSDKEIRFSFLQGRCVVW